MRNDDDQERRLPTFDPSELPNDFRNGKVRHQSLPKQPARAGAAKAAELRASLRHGNSIDWSDIHDRYVDLWHEARLAIWRAKHSKAGIKHHDPASDQDVLTFVVNEKQVLAAIDTTRAVLDSLVKLRRDLGPDANSIPRWAIDRIDHALRDHPRALHALLKELAGPIDDPDDHEND
jgi:hypothetical protein